MKRNQSTQKGMKRRRCPRCGEPMKRLGRLSIPLIPGDPKSGDLYFCSPECRSGGGWPDCDACPRGGQCGTCPRFCDDPGISTAQLK